MTFAQEAREPTFRPRAVIGQKDARTPATELLAMSDDEFRAAFKGSAMKLAGLTRNAGAVLDNAAGTDSVAPRS